MRMRVYNFLPSIQGSFASLMGLIIHLVQRIGAGQMSGATQQSTTSHDSDNADLYGGIVLGVATIAALIVANSPLGPHYDALLHAKGEVRIGSIGLSKSLDHWINDGLMAIFFLLVGLEIKREAMQGALASARKAALPVIAAIGGFVVPAAIYAAANWSDPNALRGWAIPAATDIAFALGVSAMLGRAVPASLKTFLLALAIIDDLMAIIVIAIFYTADLSVVALALGGSRCRRPRCAESAGSPQACALSRRRPVHLGLRARIRRACNPGRRRGGLCDAAQQTRWASSSVGRQCRKERRLPGSMGSRFSPASDSR
jgi:hypothetical protein